MFVNALKKQEKFLVWEVRFSTSIQTIWYNINNITHICNRCHNSSNKILITYSRKTNKYRWASLFSQTLPISYGWQAADPTGGFSWPYTSEYMKLKHVTTILILTCFVLASASGSIFFQTIIYPCYKFHPDPFSRFDVIK